MGFRDLLGKELLFFDGATGTMLQALGLQPGELPELWNFTHAAEVQSVHEAYLNNGSNIIKSNTFGANRLKFKGMDITVDEVEEALGSVAIVGKPVSENLGVSLLHWIIGDSERSIVVEQMADGMHVHHDDVDVLTNQPTFGFHMENLRNYMCVGNEMAEPATWGKASLSAWGAGVSMHGIPGDVSSPSRFVRVAYANTHYPQQEGEAANVSRLFHTLGSVQMVDGMAKMGNGQFERTLFTSGYSSKTNTYYMNTYDDPAIRSYAMADFDMDSSELITAA